MENETKPDVTNNHFFIRTIISVLVVIVYGTINNFLYAIAPVMSGKIADWDHHNSYCHAVDEFRVSDLWKRKVK